MDVEQEGKIVIGVRVLIVKQNATLEVLYRVLVVTNLEVRQSEVIVQLSVIVLDPLCLLEGRDRQHILILLIHRYAIIKEGLPTTRMILLQVSLALDCQSVPVGLAEELQAHLLELHFLLHVPFFL